MADRPHLDDETPEQREDREAYEAWAAERGWAERWKALAKRLWARLAALEAGRGKVEDGAQEGR